jgi:membrane fusion protein, copper/silver efflux system
MTSDQMDAPDFRSLNHSSEHFEEGEEAAPPGVRTMAIVRWALIALMALAAVASVVHYFGGFRLSAAQSGTQYYCPMHPSIVQDHPGECPICSMTLVPREQHRELPVPASAPGHEGVIPVGLGPVDLTPERIQLLGMRTARAKREKLDQELRTVGYVLANEKGLAQIHPRFAGWIEQLNVNQTGERVQRGQVLASIYSPELLNAQQEFISATRWSSETKEPKSVSQVTISGLAVDARRRLELLGISKTEIDRLAKTGQPMRALPVRSTVSGYVTAKNVQQGQYVDPAAVMFEVADLSTVWVLADVYEYQVERVKLGQRGSLELVGVPGRSFVGQVQFIYPSIDPTSRTLKVRMEFPNPDLKLKPGMYGNVRLQLESRVGLTVPSEAIVDTGEEQYVFVALGGGHFEPRKVRLGERSGDMTQVLEGIGEGDTVVTSANFLLDSESRLRATIEGSATAATPSDADPIIDKEKYPDKYQQYRACEVQHRGMGTMEDDCKSAIPKPWK